MNFAHPLWWLIGTVGLSGALVIAAVVIFGWPVIVGTKIGRTLLALATVGFGLVILYFKARAQGAATERQRQEKENADFVQQQDARDAGIAQSSDADLDRLLHDSREPDPPQNRGQAGVPDQQGTGGPKP